MDLDLRTNIQVLSTLQCREGRTEGGKNLWHCEGWPVGQHSQDCQVQVVTYLDRIVVNTKDEELWHSGTVKAGL